MDKNSKTFFKEDLIFLDLDFDNQNDFLQYIGAELYRKGYVKSTFTDELILREKKYPTGLPSSPFAVAIPHCDPKHVLANTISIVRFKNPVKFYEMGTLDKEIQVKFAFVLTLDGKKQIGILRDLMKLFMDSSFMEKINLANEKQINDLIEGI